MSSSAPLVYVCAYACAKDEVVEEKNNIVSLAPIPLPTDIYCYDVEFTHKYIATFSFDVIKINKIIPLANVLPMNPLDSLDSSDWSFAINSVNDKKIRGSDGDGWYEWRLCKNCLPLVVIKKNFLCGLL
jgi:hypothetical protein